MKLTSSASDGNQPLITCLTPNLFISQTQSPLKDSGLKF